VTAGALDSCAVLSTGRSGCWGWSRYIERVAGTRATPAWLETIGVIDAQTVTASGDSACALSRGSVVCW